mmetsp:Transcript_62830/g.93394  ORF Transcript_62830/g.93394 Transcript_62830/m.93394 type:complete len:83 (+) Transcript_62830:122-370(+)
MGVTYPPYPFMHKTLHKIQENIYLFLNAVPANVAVCKMPKCCFRMPFGPLVKIMPLASHTVTFLFFKIENQNFCSNDVSLLK